MAKQVKKRMISLILALVLLTSLFPGVVAAQADTRAPSGHLIINQVYGGGLGPDEGVPCTHNFIEIYNPTSADVNLSGYSVYYDYVPSGNQTSTGSSTGSWVKIDLSGTVVPGGSYLIRGAATTATTTGSAIVVIGEADLDADDLYIHNKGVKVVLMKDQTGANALAGIVNPFNTDGNGSKAPGYVDMLGVAGNDNGSKVDGCEGEYLTGKTSPYIGQSKQNAIRRINFADEDNNKEDFQAVAYKDASADFVASNRPRSMADGSWGLHDDVPADPPAKADGFNNGNSSLDLSLIARFSTGTTNPEGGVAEIIKYDSANQKFYLVNGTTKKLDIVSLASLTAAQADVADLSADASINVETAVKAYSGYSDFVYGDLTSVDVDPARGLVAVAVQAAGQNDDGAVAIFSSDGNLLKVLNAGKQPDCLVFSPDHRYILTANEGEPRDGYATGDPAGSVTIIDTDVSNITNTTSQSIGFGAFDTAEQKQALLASKVLLKAGSLPSVDFEPEYIGVTADSKYAYVSLQEANAIAKLNIETKAFEWVKGLGFKDYGAEGAKIDIYRDGQINIRQESGFKGVYMPDGIAVYDAGGTTYILTANEGDAREWESYSDITSYKLANYGQDGGGTTSSAIKIDTLKTSEFENVFESDVKYLFGGRSFSVWNASDLSLVYDSGSDFEDYTAQYLPDRFNYSNDDTSTRDKRSAKKGPEPEDVKTGTVNGVPYAFIGIERIGGVFAYSLSDISAPAFANYVNSRDFSGTVAAGVNKGDVSPEGQCFIPAGESPTGKALHLVSNEVSGTVSVFELTGAAAPSEKTITIFHTNDMHGSLIDVKTANGSKDVIGSIAALKANTPNAILADAGDATQGNAVATLTKGEDIVKLMNAAGYDVMAAGNHEFDYGQEKLLANAALANFPILSANALKNRQPLLSGAPYANGTKTNNGANHIVTVDGVKIGFFGITTPETATKTNPAGIAGIDFGSDADIKETIEEQVRTLRNAGATIVIGLVHLGVDPSSGVNQSTSIAEALAGSSYKPDIMIDGHSHTSRYDQTVNGIRIVQAGNSNNNLGKLTLTVSGATGALTDTAEQFIAQADVLKTSQVPAVTAIANEIRTKYNEMLSPVVCRTEGPLWGGTINGINEARIYETNLSDLVADSMADEVRANLAGTSYRDMPVVVLQNGGGVRASITNGIITKGDILNVLPYGNTISYKEITPKLLFEALENGVSRVLSQNETTGQISGADGRFPQVSGVRYEYDPRKPATALDPSGNPLPGQVGSRITKLVLLNSNGTDKQELSRDDSATKLVLVFTDFGFTGGDGYTMLKSLPSIGEGVTQDAALEEYLRSLTDNGAKPLPYSCSLLKGRIKTMGAYTPASYTASVTVLDTSGAIQAGKPVSYTADNIARNGTTDAQGKLSIANLADGPHSIKIADAADVLVNNYSGAGVTTAVSVRATLNPPPAGDGGSQNGGGAPPQTTNNPPAVASTDGRTTVTANTTATVDSKGVASASISESQLAEAVNAAAKASAASNTAAEVVIKVAAPSSAKSVELNIPKAAMKAVSSSSAETLTVSTPVASISFGQGALDTIAGAAAADVKISAAKLDPSSLSEADKAAAEGRPVYDFSVTSGTTKISSFGESVSVRVPYTPAAGEDLNAIVIYYMNASTGRLEPVTCKYENGAVSFVTDHFSRYVISYNKVSFPDVSGWYVDSVTYIAARGIITGMKDGRFAPESNITRAELSLMLAKMAGADLSGYTAPFSDVKAGDWFAPAVAWAYENGIVSGYGGKFRPSESISRQDIAAMLARYAEKIRYTLPRTTAPVVFTDAGDISDYAVTAVSAMQQAGVISGKGASAFGPREKATRAEASNILALFIKGMVG